MPSYTHMRRAQPILVAHFFMAHVAALRRDHGSREPLACDAPAALKEQVDAVASRGATPLLLCQGNEVLGLVVLEDILKPGIRDDAGPWGEYIGLIGGGQDEDLCPYFARLAPTWCGTSGRRATSASGPGKAGVEMTGAKARPAILSEALPYMQRYENKTIVVKYGGHAMGNPALGQAFARDIALLKQSGVNPIVVHGGGPQIGRMLDKLGIRSEFAAGLRVTDQATVEIVEMVLAGSINKEIVALINAEGEWAIGLCGKDGNMVFAEKLKRTVTDPTAVVVR